MFLRPFLFLTLLGLVVISSPARSTAADPAAPPTLVIQVRSLDGVIADVKYLAGAAGRDADAKRADDFLKKALPQGFAGLDTKQPLGFYSILDPDGNLQDISAVLLLPISNQKAFLGLLENYGVKAQKEDDGSYAFSGDAVKVPLYARFANQYAYITYRDKAAIEPKRLLKPGQIFTLGPGQTLAVSFRLDQIPDAIRQVALSTVELRLSDVEDQKPEDETAAQHAFKVQVAKEMARRFTSLLKDSVELALHLNINRAENDLSIDLALNGKPQSTLATNIADIGSTPSVFGSLPNPDSALSGLLHVVLPKSIHEALGSVIDEGIKKGIEKERDPARRAQAQKILKALVPSLKEGELDAAVDLRRIGTNKHYTLVAGIKVKEGHAIEQAVRDLLKDLPEAERAKLKLDVETAGDSHIHKMDIGKEVDAEMQRNFGANPFYVAFRTDALFVSGGDGGLDAIKNALASKPAAAPAVRVQLSMARLAALVTKSKKVDPQEVVQKAFGGADKGNDKIRFTVEGGKALRIHIELKTPIIKFFQTLDKKS
jgi:hypothetical protein